jgi:peptidoglycan/xylan/chitin deacetylase (PgdA/CDA1 family)
MRLTRADECIGAALGVRRLPLVLGYHRVVADQAATQRWLPAMSISRATFERHLDWVGRRHRFVSLDELAAGLGAGAGSARPPAAVTFDDGYADVYENAFPLLRRKGIPSAIFVVTDLVGSDELLLHDRLYLALAEGLSRGEAGAAKLFAALGPAAPVRELPRQPFRAVQWLLRRLPQDLLRRGAAALEREWGVDEQARRELRPVSWSMLREMENGGMTVGSHTRSHTLLTLESPARVQAEVAGSRDALRERLSVPARHFAYPDGRCDVAAVRAVAEAGYATAYTTCSHQDPQYPRLTIPRRLFSEQSCLDHRSQFSGAVLSCQVNGVFDLAERCRERHGWAAAQA